MHVNLIIRVIRCMYVVSNGINGACRLHTCTDGICTVFLSYIYVSTTAARSNLLLGLDAGLIRLV